MKMPSRYAFDRSKGEVELAERLHREQDASRRGGRRMVSVSARTHVLMMKLKQREAHGAEWTLDAILYQLLLEELAKPPHAAEMGFSDGPRSTSQPVRPAIPGHSV